MDCHREEFGEMFSDVCHKEFVIAVLGTEPVRYNRDVFPIKDKYKGC